VIVVPSNAEQVEWCKAYMGKAGVYPSEWAQFLVWEKEGIPRWMVCFDDWIGTTCQLHMASETSWHCPTKLIQAVFRHAFGPLKRSHVFGLVNSNNERAMRFDLWLGFKEVLRVPGCHTEGGDLVVLMMTPADCRWLEEAHNGQARTSNA
jgi:hypothetical protein